MRFVFDTFILIRSTDHRQNSFFLRLMLWEVVTVLDGVSFLALLICHFSNFKSIDPTGGNDSNKSELDSQDEFD